MRRTRKMRAAQRIMTAPTTKKVVWTVSPPSYSAGCAPHLYTQKHTHTLSLSRSLSLSLSLTHTQGSAPHQLSRTLMVNVSQMMPIREAVLIMPHAFPCSCCGNQLASSWFVAGHVAVCATVPQKSCSSFIHIYRASTAYMYSAPTAIQCLQSHALASYMHCYVCARVCVYVCVCVCVCVCVWDGRVPGIEGDSGGLGGLPGRSALDSRRERQKGVGGPLCRRRRLPAPRNRTGGARTSQCALRPATRSQDRTRASRPRNWPTLTKVILKK